MQNIQNFMCIYMYKLEEDLTNHKDDLIEVSFQSDEANTDRPLKEYLKKHIESISNETNKILKKNRIKIAETDFMIMQKDLEILQLTQKT